MNKTLKLFIRFYVSTWSRLEIAFFIKVLLHLWKSFWMPFYCPVPSFFFFFVFYCLWFYFMELGGLRSSQPEGTWVIDTEHTVTSELIPIFLPYPLKKKKQHFFLPLAWKTIFMAWSALLSQHDGKYFSIKNQGETRRTVIFRILESSHKVYENRDQVSNFLSQCQYLLSDVLHNQQALQLEQP